MSYIKPKSEYAAAMKAKWHAEAPKGSDPADIDAIAMAFAGGAIRKEYAQTLVNNADKSELPDSVEALKYGAPLPAALAASQSGRPDSPSFTAAHRFARSTSDDPRRAIARSAGAGGEPAQSSAVACAGSGLSTAQADQASAEILKTLSPAARERLAGNSPRAETSEGETMAFVDAYFAAKREAGARVRRKS